MTHFLRDDNNTTILEIDEIGVDDFRSAVDILVCTRAMLDKVAPGNRDAFAVSISTLNELRRCWWEKIPPGGSEDEMRHFIAEQTLRVAALWDLCYITD